MSSIQKFNMLLFFILYVAMVLVQAEVNLEQNSNRIARWSNQVSMEVANVFEDSVGFSKFQSLVNKASYRTVSQEGNELIENISIAIDQKLRTAVQTLIANKALIESEYVLPDQIFGPVWTDCCDSSYEMGHDDARFKSKVNRSLTCVILQSTQDNPRLSSSLESVYKRNLINSKAIKWQYFGSNSGSYHQYPANDNVCSNSDIFDPRLRSWYVDAAMSTRKNLIIIIDRSGSMRRSGRMSLARAAALTVLDTLTPDDYVTAVAFSSGVSFPAGCFGKTLAKATASNLEVLKNWIKNLLPGGGTIYSVAFTEAFNCFENFESAKNGQNIMLFLTDGQPSDKPNEAIYPSTIQGQLKMNNSVTILTYGLGRGIGRTATDVLSKISNMNGGKFTHIEDGSPEKLKSAFGRYYQYFITASGNLALGKPAIQSSVISSYSANHAVDGRVDGKCSKTTFENDPWWRVDLQQENNIMAVTVTNCCEDIMENLEIRISNNVINDNRKCGVLHELQDKQSKTVFCSSDLSGRYVDIRIPGKNKSLAICEVQIYKNLAPSSTLSTPCTTEKGTIFGVAAVDISLGEVFSELLSFSYGYYSYGLVIDVKGRVWIHPRSPHPEQSEFGPSLLPLPVYESWVNDAIMQNILSDSYGQITVDKVLLQFPRGYSNTDGMETKTANATVYWKRISNMFILIMVMVENDTNIWLMPEKVTEEKSVKEPDKDFGVCQVNGSLIFTEFSIVTLTSGNKIGILENSKMKKNVSLAARIRNKIIKETQDFPPAVHADVAITGYLDRKWRESRDKDSNSVMWRYVGTQSGVYRRYPGVTLTASVDHKNNPWFRRAVTAPEKLALSYPFDNPYGRGSVISLTKAVPKHRKYSHSKMGDNGRTRIMAVVGMDMTLRSFQRMALNLMPGCADEYDCFFMDQSGYLFLKLNEKHDVVHVTEKFSWLGKQFLESLKILKPMWCNNFMDFQVHLYYETVLLRKIISNTTNICRQYILLPLQNISTSILVLPSRKIQTNCQDRLPGNDQEGCNLSKICHTCSYNITQCQVPCSCPMSFDRCSNSIINIFTRITCPAPSTTKSLINAAVLDNTMNSTKIPKCEKKCNAALDKQQCHEMPHCLWCENNILNSCENFCPFNKSQRIGLKFSIKAEIILPNLNEKSKEKIEKTIQETMYSVLGEKLENNIHNVTFKKSSIILTIQGSTTGDIYTKVRNIRTAIESKKFYINITNNGSIEKIYTERLDIMGCNNFLCHSNATCTNRVGSFQCACRDGFVGDGFNCSDVDECEIKPCHSNATCTNTEGSYTCNCLRGFSGNGTLCADINECDYFPCNSNATCTNHVGSFQCACREGFVGNGFNCSDVDECEIKRCHSNATCTNTQGSYTCNCLRGFSGNGTQCADIDECDYFPCHSNATCTNTQGSYTCNCPRGFSGNGTHCADINECDYFPCHSNATCTNHVGSFQCACREGFVGDGFNCSDIDECDHFPCHSNATCTNTQGSYTCNCLRGFSGNGTQCADINECDYFPCHSNATCTNTQGSYTCNCLRGFSGNGTQCADINECDYFPCHSNATCTNTQGSYTCNCLRGFSGNGTQCADINECDYFPCHSNATCTNTQGSYTCNCLRGFSGNGTQCADIDECDYFPYHSNATCTNTQGSYTCNCLRGFSGNGTHCADINECDYFPCHSNATCTNHVGSFQCACREGFVGDGLNCSAIDECDHFPCHSNATCTNTQGSYTCNCLRGYSGNGTQCADINECDYFPCHLNATCTNHVGSFQCVCREGFVGDGLNCSDVNECEIKPCHSNATCTNTKGSYTCNCLPGFSGNGPHCADINECGYFPCHSNATCTNHVGSFQCACREGFVGDGFNCSDVDECEIKPRHSNATCTNTQGSCTCKCLRGFSGNEPHCADINECDYFPCHSNATCTNRVGSFQCACREGFVGDGFNCSNVNECDHFLCHSNATCTNTQGSYTCNCLRGFSGNGTHCTDINECDHFPCHSNVTCTNTQGSYTCKCFRGFSGNETRCVDINECDYFPCHSNATCTNHVGSFQCACREGFVGNGFNCSDVDECEIKPCHSNATCTNTPGSYTCYCLRGYSGTFCVDIDECELDDNVCHSNATCTNVIGSFRCKCHEGFTGDGFTCSDNDECNVEKLCHQNATCINIPGTYKCSCLAGFFGDGTDCLDINECLGAPCQAYARCTNVAGSYYCSCLPGYVKNGTICQETFPDERTEEPITATVAPNAEKGDDYSGVVVVVMVITSFIIGTSCGLCCIIFVLSRKNSRKNKVMPKSNDLEIQVLRVKEVENNNILSEGNDWGGRLKKTEINKPTQHFKVITHMDLEWNDVEI